MARPGLTKHIKFKRLSRDLRSRIVARGVLELLWEPCYENGDSLQRQMAFNDISTFGMPFIGFETMEEVEGFMKKLEEIARRSKTTHWLQRKEGRGRKRLPVQAIILHHHAKRMIEACGGAPSSTPEANVSELGSYLCTIARVAMPSDESSKAVRLACNDWERREYDLIPDYPLDTPLPKFEVNINKEVMKK